MTIDLDQAIRTLEDLRRNDPVIQRGRNGELTTAFKAFWGSHPDEATFCKHTAGLLITPAILYHMVNNPISSPVLKTDLSAIPLREPPEEEKQKAETAKATEAIVATPAPTKKGGKDGARK